MDTRSISVERIRIELTARKLMVTLLAVTTTWVGIMIILTGAPNFLEEWFSPWSRYLVGGLAFGAGTAAAFGSVVGEHRWCGWINQVLGLLGMILWFLFMAVAYAALVVRQDISVVGPGEAMDVARTGRGYVPILFTGLAGVTSIPLVMMLLLGRNNARRF